MSASHAWAAPGQLHLSLPTQNESCGEISFAGLPCVSPSPAHVTTRLSDEAQNTSSPASCGQANGPGSAPEHANSLTPGATSPQLPPLHLPDPLAPEKPIALQITPAVPAVAPLLQIGTHALSMKTSGLPFPSRAGDPSAVIKRTAPCDAPGCADAVQ